MMRRQLIESVGRLSDGRRSVSGRCRPSGSSGGGGGSGSGGSGSQRSWRHFARFGAAAGRPISAGGVGIVQLAGVFLEIKIAAESLAAHAAGERLLLVVRVHVEGQVVHLVEGLVADDALVGLLAAVGQLVVLVVALLMEALAAELADERLESGVDAHVRVERRAAVERLAARVTLVRLVGRVDDLVAAQGRRLPESLAAHLADEGPRARVHRHVARQVVVSVEHFAAVGTREHAPLAALRIHFRVVSQSG